jgi:hypothetical protein
MLRTSMLAAGLALVVTRGICNEPAAAVYAGQYFYNFENAYFTLKGGTECWAVKGDLSAAELPGKGGAGPWGTADVVIRGVLSPKGHYGNLGACTHKITLLKVLSISNKVPR